MTKNEFNTLKELIENKLTKEEDDKVLELMQKWKKIKKRGYFTKEEFLEICNWKTPVQKKDKKEIQKIT